MASITHNTGRVARIMQSYDGLPTWVKIWMNFILGPINLATLFFLNQPSGGLIAALAIGGMVLTVALVVLNAGFEKIVAAGHVLPWVPLVAMLAFARPEAVKGLLTERRFCQERTSCRARCLTHRSLIPRFDGSQRF